MSKDYTQMTDEDILLLYRQGDEDALDHLMERYKNLVRKKARTLFLIGGDSDDLIQEGMIGLYKASRDFDPERERSFFQFAELCISRQLYNAITASRRNKNIPLNSYVSIYSPLGTESSETEYSATLADTLRPTISQNPEEILIDKENAGMIEYELGKRLSSLENEVLRLFMNGNDYQQIAATLERSPKSIDNALQRIRTKLLSIVEKE